MSMNKQSLHVLRHALGLSERNDKPYRNRYMADEDCDAWPLLMEHVAAGRMERLGPFEACGGMFCFKVTDAGRAAVGDPI